MLEIEIAESADDSGGGDALGVELALNRARAGGRDTIADALLIKQTEKLDHELHHLKLRAISEWFAILLRSLTVVAGLTVGSAVVLLMVEAIQSHDLAVAPFHVPPDMAEKGTDGQVLANQVLDKLNDMRAMTDSQAQNTGYSSEAAAEIKLEIPDTGMTFGELHRLLREWLGHDTRISGSLVRLPGGEQGGQMVLTTRTGPSAQRSTGTEADLDRLTTAGAESIYAATQPLAFADYLRSLHRVDEVEVLLRRLTTTGTNEQRAWAYSGLGEVLMRDRGDFAGAQRAMDEAAILNPNLWKVWENLADLNIRFQPNEERALAYRRKAAAANDFGGADANSGKHFHLIGQIYIDEQLGDFAHALAISRAEAENQSQPGLAYQSSYLVAYEAAYLHDLALSRRWAGRAMDHAAAMLVAGFKLYDPALVQHRLGYWQAATTGDWATAAREMAAANAMVSTDYWIALQATALVGADQLPQAVSLLEKLPVRCYFCNVARGMLAEARHDRAAADRIFAALARDNPSLARRQEVWGRIKLARGDHDGANAIFARVNKVGPHFADALEGWGEGLTGKNQSHLALAKFAAAEKYAPNWGRLHLKWGEALTYAGRKEEAKAQFARAATLDLTPAEKAELLWRQPGRVASE